MNDKQEVEFQVVNYDVSQINRVLEILNDLPITGLNNCRAISEIYDILNKPLEIDLKDLAKSIIEEEKQSESQVEIVND
jgi:hypothetical protein